MECSSKCVSRQDYDCMIGIAKAMYETFIKEFGQESAYAWAMEHIDAYFQEQLGIKPMKNYKAVNVKMEMKLIVPKIWEKADIEDFIFTLPLADEGNTVTIEDCDEEYDYDDIRGAKYNYNIVFNDPLKFTDEDFVAGYGYNR